MSFEKGSIGPRALPWINNNGDTRADLMHGHAEALHALDAALDQLAKITPHGRNYGSPIDAARAREDHMAQVAALLSVRKHFEDVAQAINRQSF